MRINPIIAQVTITKMNQRKNLKNSLTMANPQLSFKASAYEEEVEREVKSKRDNYNWWQWNMSGAEEKERQVAKARIDKRNHDNEIARVQAETLNKANAERMADLQNYTSKLEIQQRQNDKLMEEYKKSHEETVLIQKQALEAQSQAAESLKSQLQDYQRIMKEQQELQAKKEQETQELLKKMEEARENRDKKMEERFEKELQRMKEMYEAQIKAKAQQAEKVRNVEEIFRKMNEVNDNKGFGRIAGYGKEKDILMQMVGSPIVLEKDGQQADVPNGILFFGPKGNGKTVFAETFAQQLDCNLVKLEDTLDPVENIKNLREVAKNAQKRFEETGVRTIIQIDEFDDFAPKGSKIVGPLKSFMDNVSKKMHCTIFATTNYPEKIDDILLRDSRFEVKVPLSPADKPNALAILKYYGEKFADNTVNFEKLAEEITKGLPIVAYSNDRLSHLVSTYAKKHNLTKLSHKDFLESIKALNPDIKKETMELFKKQIEYIKHA